MMIGIGNYRKNNTIARILLLVMMTFSSLSSHGQAPTKTEWIKSSAITGAGMAAVLGMRYVPTPQCYWCTTNQFDETISRGLLVSDIGTARMASDYLTFLGVPLITFGSIALSNAHFSEALRDSMVIVATLATTIGLTELVKISARRERPDVTFGISAGGEHCSNRSFLSGHTSFAFSQLTAASIMALRKGYRWAPYFAGFSAVTGAAVGYSRIMSARHWMTDVLAGMTLGITIGAITPFIILEPIGQIAPTNVMVVPAADGLGLEVAMLW